MAIHAIGASYSYIPHLRIQSFENSTVKSMEVNKKGMSNLNVDRFADGKVNDDNTGKIVLAFNGAENKKGQEFLNQKKEVSIFLEINLISLLHSRKERQILHLFMQISSIYSWLTKTAQKKFTC